MPSASIIAESDGLMRNAYSLRPGPASSVICGLEAMPVIIGILASATIFMLARCAELQCEPSIAATLASTSLVATFTASDGLLLLSSTMSSILRPPKRPPAALISSTARLTPHISHSDATAATPVCGVETPITIGCASAGPAFSAEAAMAAIQNFTLIMSLRSRSPYSSEQHSRRRAKQARDALGSVGHQRLDALQGQAGVEILGKGDAQRRHDAARTIADRRADREHARNVLLVDDGEALAPHLGQRRDHGDRIGDGMRRDGGELARAQKLARLAVAQCRQKHLAGAGAVQRHLAARADLDGDRAIGLHGQQIDRPAAAQHRDEAVQMVPVRQPFQFAASRDDVVEGILAACPECQRAMAEAIARGFAVLLDVAARRERADQALHDGRTERRPAGELADADVGAFGGDHLQYVETALEGLRSRRPLGVGALGVRWGGARPRHHDHAAGGHVVLERGPLGPLKFMMRTWRSALPCAKYRYIVSIVAGSQVSGLSVNDMTTNRLHRSVRLAGPGIAQPRSQ